MHIDKVNHFNYKHIKSKNMKKTKLIILLLGVFTLGMTGCGDFKVKEKTEHHEGDHDHEGEPDHKHQEGEEDHHKGENHEHKAGEENHEGHAH
jgi:hypothetical protein